MAGNEIFLNAASCTLAQNYTAGSGTMTVSGAVYGSGYGQFPSALGAGQFFRVRCSNVIFKVTAVNTSTNVWTVSAVETADANITAGPAVTSKLTAAAVQEMHQTGYAELTDADMAAANKDGTATTPSLRTLGTGAQQAMAGNAAPNAHAASHAAGGSDALPWTTIHGSGTLANRPAAAGTNAGYTYYATDTGIVYQSSGTAWTVRAQANSGAALPTATADYAGSLFVRTSDNTLWFCNTSPAWIEASAAYTLPAATTSALGGVEIDKAPASGNPIAITAAGLTPATTSGAPTTGTYALGELYVDSNHVLYECTVAGTPGTWVTLSSTAPTGQSVNKVQLGFTQTADVGNTAIAANTWTNIASQQSFTVDDSQSAIEIIVRGNVLVGNGSGAGNVASQMLVDGTAYKLGGAQHEVAGQYQNALAGAQPLLLTNLAAGAHTLQLQAWMDVAGYVFLEPTTSPNFSSLEMVVIERKVSPTGPAGTLDMVRAYQTVAQSIPSAAWTALTFDTNDWDTNGLHSTTTNPTRLTAKVAGKYRFSGFASVNATQTDSGIRVYKNGTTEVAYNEDNFNSNTLYLPISGEVALATGDYLELHVYQNNAAAANTLTTHPCSFAMERIDGYALNPMTAPGDLIVGGASGLAQRLATPGSASRMLAAPHGAPTWTGILHTAADLPPASPTSWDDEFNSATMNSKWTASIGAGHTSDVDATVPSAWFIGVPSGTANDSSLTQPFAPGAGAFSVTAKYLFMPTANYMGCDLVVGDSTWANVVKAACEFNSGNSATGPSISWMKVVGGGTLTANLNPLTTNWPGWPGIVYLHLQCDASSNYSLYASHDGFSFYPIITAQNLPFTVAQLQLTQRQSGATAGRRSACDWVRVNWLSL